MKAPKKVPRQRAAARKSVKPRAPKPGERLTLEQLFPTTRVAFKRISQIYGIPLRELTPFFGGRKMNRLIEFIAYAKYSPVKHEIQGNIFSSKGIPTIESSHELWHALQSLLRETRGKMDVKEQIGRFDRINKPKVRDFIRLLGVVRREKKIDRTLSEPTAYLDYNFPAQIVGGMLVREWALLISGFIINPAFSALAIASTIKQSTRNFIAKGFYKRHGIDGMLLFFAYPPKKFDVIRLRAHERKLVKEGYLKEKGGMTRKGIQLLRQLVPRETIIKRAKRKSK